MYRILLSAFIFFMTLSFFSSCISNEQAKEESEKKEKQFPAPETITITPAIINTDTCPPPQEIDVPSKSGSSYTLKTKSESKTIALVPTVTKPAGFFAQMKNYTTEHGLALSGIACGFKDKAGNMWFGTYGGGVSRYDGKTFTNFTTAQGLTNNLVLCVYEDKKGNIWFGTSGEGVSCYNGRSFKNFKVAQGLANNKVNDITEDNEGDMWFSTSEGISRYNGKSFKNYTTDRGLADNLVMKCRKDKKGNLWFATGAGASCYDGKIFTNYTTEQGLVENTVTAVTEDKNGNLWFGTFGGKASLFDGRSFTNFSLAPGSIESIIEDKNGTIWFASHESGAISYDGKTFSHYTVTEGLVNNVINSITEDKNGNLWFGSYGGGLSRYDGRSFTSYNATQGLGSDIVWSIGEDKKGNIWFGTYGGGAARYDGKSFTNFTTAQGLAQDVVYGITEDKKGNLWFGTALKGVSCYNGKSFKNFTTQQGLVNNVVWFITADSKGNVWFGTQSGVSCYDGRSFKNFTTAQGLKNDVVYSIIEDKKGNIWMGTDGAGVMRYDGKTFTSYTSKQGLPGDLIYSVLEDKKGNLWFGIYGGGISRYDGKSFLNFSKAEGLADDNVSQVLEDKNGAIWIGTNWGLSKLNFKASRTGDSLKAIIPGANSLSNEELKNYKPAFETYNQRTGYPVKDVNVGQNCMFIDSKGIIWAATGDNKTALVRFDPSSLNHNPDPPSISIHEIKINEENISWYDLLADSNSALKDSTTSSPNILEEVNIFGRRLTEAERDTMRKQFRSVEFDSIAPFYPLPQNLVLTHDHNNITFEFGAIEPARSFLVNYQYILEGYDKNWCQPTGKTTATFGNIYEGEYTFKVKAQSPEGVWCEPITYTFKVLPPWYRTWWMYGSEGIAAFVLLFGLYNWRTASLRRDKEMLEETVKERTAEAIKQKEEAQEQKHIVEEKQREILDSIHYAKKIQEALLGEEEHVSEHLPNHFILFKPKDIISGDFYWSQEKQRHLYIAAADCTGHGVPGAMMSMLGIAFLNEITNSDHLLMPSEILTQLREKVVKELGASGQTKDGMDISLCRIDLKTNEVVWAGANNPLWILREENGKRFIEEITADKQTIGYNEKYKPYTDHVFKKMNGTFYLFTDGYADQFGGAKGKKFMYKPLKDRLISVSDQPLETQKKILLNTFDDWKGELAQVDDVCLIAIRIS